MAPWFGNRQGTELKGHACLSHCRFVTLRWWRLLLDGGKLFKVRRGEIQVWFKDCRDLPVDSPELIAMCAPRLVFVSYGIPAKGDARWLDHQGSFMAVVDASRVYQLLGVHGLEALGDYHTAKMPPLNQGLLDGQLAWRQHDGGHTDAPNMKYFLSWASKWIAPTP